MDKREFLKCACLGAGGCVLGLGGIDKLLAWEGGSAFAGQSDDSPGKWSTEAQFVVATSGGFQCRKCPHGCFLGPGDMGRCRNRINLRGKVYSLAYGNPCAVHIDPVEKKPLFHFLPSSHAFSIAAAGCNLRCLNCQNWEISQKSPRETENVDMMPARVVDEAVGNGCASIAYTYSEPVTFYEYVFDTATIAREQHTRNIFKSSGYINEAPLRKLCRVIDAANIDLKGFDEKTYQDLNGVRLAPVLETLKVLKQEGVWLEITNLVIPTWTDKPDVIGKMTDWLCANGFTDTPLHFSRFMPLYKLDQLPSTPVATLEMARDTALHSGMKYVYIGNVPGHDAENTYCPKCKTLLVERKGYLIVKNRIVAGTCSSCGTRIPGVWS